MTSTITPAEARAELDRRAHNRRARKDDSLTRREAATAAVFAASKADLEAVLAAPVLAIVEDDDEFTPAEFRCPPDTCGDCDNYSEGCDTARSAYAHATVVA